MKSGEPVAPLAQVKEAKAERRFVREVVDEFKEPQGALARKRRRTAEKRCRSKQRQKVGVE